MNDIWDALEGLRDAPVVADGRRYADDWAAAAQLASRRRRLARPMWLGTALAAGIIVAVGGWALATGAPTARTFTTAVGETRTVALADGSRVTLDSDTRLRARMTWRSRIIELDHGQARFAVAHDAAHPFRVRAGGSETTALGTVFNVSQSPYQTTVTLIEGRVKVSGPAGVAERVLDPGQQVEVAPNGRLGLRRHASIEQATAWQRGVIDLDDVALDRALFEVNRYSRTKVVLTDPQKAAVHVSGLFTAGDTASVAATINGYFGEPVVRLAEPVG